MLYAETYVDAWIMACHELRKADPSTRDIVVKVRNRGEVCASKEAGQNYAIDAKGRDVMWRIRRYFKEGRY